MRTLVATIALAFTLGCAGFHWDTGNAVAAALRACAVVDVLEAEEVIKAEDIKEAKKACRILRAVAGLPPIDEDEGRGI